MMPRLDCALACVLACALSLAAEGRETPREDVARLEQRYTAAPDNNAVTKALAGALLAEVRLAPRAETLARAVMLIEQLQARHAAGADALDAWRLLIEHRFAAALVAARRARHADADDLLGLCSEADALTELGRYDEAEDVVQRLLDDHYGIAALSRASHLRFLFGDLSGARTLTEKALALNASATDHAWLLLDLAQLELAGGAASRSLALAQLAVGSLPEASLAAQARALEALGDPRAALALFGVLASRAPRAEMLVEQLRLARALHDSAQAARSARLLTAMAQLDALQGQADNRSHVEFAVLEHRLADATALARDEWRRRPDVVSAAQLAWVLHLDGKTTEASVYARRALAEHTVDPLLMLRAGTVLSAAGDQQARALVSQALRLQPWLAAQSSVLAAQP